MNKTRPRGFIKYTPRREAKELIEATIPILTAYDDILPIILRQLFYILVTRAVLGKTENDYKSLCEKMGSARRGGLVPMDAFRDDGFIQNKVPGWAGTDSLMDAFFHTAETFTLDRQIGQEQRLVVWCEAGGMVPQLERVAHKYSIPVYSSGGFDSLTAKHDQGRLLGALQGANVLHFGDHDPSGVHMYKALAEGIGAFANHYGNDVKFERLAVTPDQIEKYNLPTSPPKASDNRKFKGVTTQCEALDPRTLANILETAISDRLDMDVYQRVLKLELQRRDELVQKVQSWQ